jgi:RNA polymerase sigma factor (sigma-70 family)
VNDEQLIKGCKNSDRKAQELLYERYSDKLFRLGYRYVRSTVDTEDVLIVAFGKVFSGLAGFRFQGEGSLEGWIRKIVVNEALMWLRKRHNFNLTENLDAALTEPDLGQFSESGAEDIYKAIAELPTGYRTVFNLSVIEGFHHDEIAQMLGISDSTSRSQLFKAKALLKKILTREGFNYGT